MKSTVGGSVMGLVVMGISAALIGCNAGQNGGGRPVRPGGGVTAEDCHWILEKGIEDKVSTRDMVAFSADFRDWLKSSRNERHTLKKSGNVEGKIGYKAFSFGLNTAWSLDKLDELDARFEGEKTYVLSNDEYKEMTMSTIRVDLVEQYNLCLDKVSQGPAAPLRLAPIRANTTERQLAFTLSVLPPDSGTRTIRIKSVLVRGAKLEPGVIVAGGTVSSAKPETLIVMREPLAGGGYDEVNVWVFTDVQDVGKVVKAVPPIPPPPQPRPEEFDRAAFEKAHKEWAARNSEYVAGKEYPGSWIKMPRAGGNSFSIDHIAVGERFVGIHGRPGKNCDNFRFKIRRADGSTVDSKWLNDPNRLGGDKFNCSFATGEYIVGYRIRHGDNTDAVWFVTNTGGEHRIGGTGGEHWIPAGGGFSLGPGNDYELVGLDSVAGRNVDGLKGYFRRVFTPEELREPKLEDFPLPRK